MTTGRRTSMRNKRRGHEAMLVAFDLIEHDGGDLRDVPLTNGKRRLAKLIGKAKRRAVTRDRRPAFPKNSRQTSRARTCQSTSGNLDADSQLESAQDAWRSRLERARKTPS